jgi:hypothetical protein
MDLLDRVKAILATPTSEWLAIAREAGAGSGLIVRYVAVDGDGERRTGAGAAVPIRCGAAQTRHTLIRACVTARWSVRAKRLHRHKRISRPA